MAKSRGSVQELLLFIDEGMTPPCSSVWVVRVFEGVRRPQAMGSERLDTGNIRMAFVIVWEDFDSVVWRDGENGRG